MLFHATANGQKLFLPGELKGDVDNAFPIGRITGCVGGRFEASRLYSSNGGGSETVAEAAGDTQDLNSTGGRDTKTDGDGAFNMKLDGLRGVLWTGFKQDLGCGTGCDRRWACRLRHRWRSVLTKVDRTSNTTGRIHRTRSTGDPELHTFYGTGGVIPTIHVLAAG